ncbi:CAP domain-containing protein [Streptomyces sp. NPDC048604]|uniref:CAP domain-containing protein n=1 Tax=Streptomyces sp. NPDC048604 TaxID=3365578 RepID=UPI0037236D5A
MGRHRRKRGSRPVRTGLLGVSAAVAVGAVAVASGLLPGGDTFDVGGAEKTTQAQQRKLAELLTQQGGASVTPSQSASAAPRTPSTAAPKPKPTPTKTATKTPAKTPAKTAKPTPSAKPSKPAAPKPTKTATSEPTKAPEPRKTTETRKPTKRVTVPVQTARDVAAESEVLRLVNAERARVGCQAVSASPSLGRLAGAFSADMANRAFFDHTDPDGDTPWDRAAQAGVLGLGGENIARGQADAAAVMAAWMNSDGHRANILNCDYTRLGVGVHYADGGPWWTQDFGV